MRTDVRSIYSKNQFHSIFLMHSYNLIVWTMIISKNVFPELSKTFKQLEQWNIFPYRCPFKISSCGGCQSDGASRIKNIYTQMLYKTHIFGYSAQFFNCQTMKTFFVDKLFFEWLSHAESSHLQPNLSGQHFWLVRFFLEFALECFQPPHSVSYLPSYSKQT